jgi:hypothetical protein
MGPVFVIEISCIYATLVGGMKPYFACRCDSASNREISPIGQLHLKIEDVVVEQPVVLEWKGFIISRFEKAKVENLT